MMEMNSEALLALGSALIEYTGASYFESLDLSNNYIKGHGIKFLSSAVFISVRKINLHELNLSKNFLE